MNESIRKLAILVPAALTICCAPVWAGVAGPVISVQSVSADPGSVGNFFDVLITNPTQTDFGIGGFSFGLSVATTDIVFDLGDFSSSSAAYIFDGISFDQDTATSLVAVNTPPQSLEGADFSFVGMTLAAGHTLGLGRIEYDVLAGTPAGPYTVTVAPNCPETGLCTSLNDNSDSALAIPFSVSNGTITVNTQQISSTPEPSTILLGLLVLPAALWKRRR